MKLTVFTDLHTHNYTQFNVNTQRLENCLKVIDDVYRFNVKNGIKYILFGGDIVDQQQAVPTVVAEALTARIKQRIDENPEIIWLVITGNHDQGSQKVIDKKCVSYMSVLALAFPHNFIVIDEGAYSVGDDEECGVYGISYHKHPEHFKLALEQASLKAKTQMMGTRVLMIHQTPTGLDNPNIPTDTDVNDPLYDIFDLVLCGHIHQKKKITPKFYILGTPLHRDLGDEGDEKGFWCFDTEGPAESMTFITRKGRYPEFMRVAVEKITNEMQENNFVIPQIIVTDLSATEVQDMENFSSSLSAKELIENYWKSVDNKDQELLKTGLQFI